MGDPPVVLAAQGLCKRYGAVTALEAASLDLRAGRITAIVGENGAGKSTLARTLAGAIRPDAGITAVDGRPVAFRSRAQAIRLGIGFVPQGLSFIGTLSMIENHCLTMKGLFTDRSSARTALQEACAAFGAVLPLDAEIERLSLAERQLGEIASAIAGSTRVLLLDEPTAILGPFEIDRLLESLRRLAKLGVAIGLVTHRVREVLACAQRVVVLRQGVVVCDTDATGLDAAAVTRLMIARPVQDATPPPPRTSPQAPCLVVQDVHVRQSGQTILSDISFEVRRGEILGVAGVAGPAQSALAETLVGLRRHSQGRILLDGARVGGAAAISHGIAYVPEDRSLGLAVEMDLAANASLLHLRDPAFRRFGLRRRAMERERAQALIARFDIRPHNPGLKVGLLSGGNQQKLLVARELERNPSLVILHGPTQGLDLAAAAGIRTAITRAARHGSAMLLISSDLEEILALSHRIIVLTGGRITARLDCDAALDADRLGLAMTDTTMREAC